MLILASPSRPAKLADEAGLVLVGDVDHRLAELGIDPDALDVDQPRLAVGIDRARHRALLPLGGDGDRDQAFVVALRRAHDLVDHHAALLGDDRRRDHVDVAQHRPQQARQHRRGQRLDLHFGDVALIGDLHLRDAGLGELAGERAELFGKLDERLQLRRLFRRDRREIDRVGDRAGQKIIRHLLGDLQRDVLLRLGGGGAQMRRADHVGMAEQHVGGGRLLDEHVERRARDLLGIRAHRPAPARRPARRARN